MNSNRPSVRARRAGIASLLGLTVAIFVVAFVTASAGRAQPAAALGPIPPSCVEHVTFVSGGTDYHGDYRCKGFAIQFHTAGVGSSPQPIWAGQWLLLDENGAYRMGWCTFNRGIHPTVDLPSVPVAQTLPKDPTGAKAAYLTWRYGRTTDDLTAAGLWAVFHYYAQDAAGSNRANDPTKPLIASLTEISEMSGRQDIEDRAVSLDAEATRGSAPLVIVIDLDPEGHGVVRVRAGNEGVVNSAVQLRVTGAAFDDESTELAARTDGNGDVAFEVSGPPHEIHVEASAAAPGPAVVYLAAAADPVGHLPQTLLTAGTPGTVRGEALVTLAAPPATTTTEPATTTTEPATTATEPATTTTEPATTTTEPATTTTNTTTTEPATTTTSTTTTEPATTTTSTTTTEPATTTTEPATTTTNTTTTEPATTTTEPATTTTEPPPTTITTTTGPPPTTTTTTITTTTTTTAAPTAEIVQSPPPPPELPAQALPRTGSSDAVAYLGTSLMVAGIGLIGAVRRRSVSLASRLRSMG